MFCLIKDWLRQWCNLPVAVRTHLWPYSPRSASLRDLSFLNTALEQSETPLDVKDTGESILPFDFSKTSPIYDCSNCIVLNFLLP